MRSLGKNRMFDCESKIIQFDEPEIEIVPKMTKCLQLSKHRLVRKINALHLLALLRLHSLIAQYGTEFVPFEEWKFSNQSEPMVH